MKKLTIDQFIKKSNIIHCNKYFYSKSIYKNNSTKIIITCPVHGDFLQIPNSHLLGKGCSLCANNILVSNQAFIDKANIVHKFKFDYSKVIYKNSKSKLIIICKNHGEFNQTANAHLSGSGCYECSVDYKKITKEDFIRRSMFAHDFEYDYSKVNYINSYTEIDIICKDHGSFKAIPYNHIVGKDFCKRCKYQFLLDSFKEKSNKTHIIKYDYSKTFLTSYSSIVNIKCFIHGFFRSKASIHMNGADCLKCSKKNISKSEESWLDSLSIPKEFRNIRLFVGDRHFWVDAFFENKIYEFNGDYWHGNPIKFKSTDINKSVKITFGELYKKTIEKEKAFKRSWF